MKKRMLLIVFLLCLAGAGIYFFPKTKPATTEPEILPGGDRDIHGCIGSAGYSWCDIKQKCLRIWEEPCDASPTLDETETIKSAMKTAIVVKRGADAANLMYTVSKVEGSYAKGGASGEGGGGMWFAAKAGGTWNLVWDGNGIIQCPDLTDYPEFPTKMIPECWDVKTDKIVLR